MKFSLLTPMLALAGAITAAPAPKISTSQLSIGTANTMVEALHMRLLPMMQSINSTVADFQAGKLDKPDAIHHVGAQFQSMTSALNTATAEIGTAARKNALQTREIEDVEARQDNDALERLAKNLQTTLTALAGTVNTALLVLGLTPLLAFLQPLTGSLSGIVLMLITVVNPLLAVLRVLLDGVLRGVSGLLGGLIL